MATTIGGSTKPAFVRDEHLDYLDELFESYAVEVRRAPPLLCSAFQLGEREAEVIVEFWRSTFGRRLTRS